MPTFEPGNTPTTNILSQTIGEAPSDTSSNVFTPEITPSETPRSHITTTIEKLDLKGLVESAEMDKNTTEGQEQAKEEVQPSPAEGSSATKVEVRVQGPGEAGIKKAICKKHSKPRKSIGKRRKSKKESSSGSDSSSDTSSDSSEDDSEEDETSSEEESEDEAARKKRKSKARRKAKKLKAKKKAKSKKHKESSTESSEEDSSSDESSSEDEKSKKAQKKKKRKAKKAKRAAETDATEVEAAVDPVARAQAQMMALGLRGIPPRKGVGGAKLVAARNAALKMGLPGKPPTKVKTGKKKRASKVDFMRVDQLWDSSIHNYKLTETADDPSVDEYDSYIFTVRRKFDWENKYTDTVVDIKSKLLKEALNHVMKGVKGVSLVEATPIVDPNMLFLYLEELRDYVRELRTLRKTETKKKARKAAAVKAAHVKVLVKYLDKDYSETKKTLYPLLENRTITFDLLWALFKPNIIVYTTTYNNHDEPRAFKMEYATKESSFMRGQWYTIEGRYLEYDGKTFGMGMMEVDVEAFKGPRKITGLSCYPLKYHRDPDGITEKLTERGKKFMALRGMNYRFHQGMGFYKKKRAVIKVNINGRVMVDPAIHRRINPNYSISTVKPKDPDTFSDGNDSSGESCCCDGDSSGEEAQKPVAALGEEALPKTKFKVVKDKTGRVQLAEVELDEHGKEIEKEKMDQLSGPEDGPAEREFTDEELLIASPVVLGFAFSEKLWLEFTVSGIRDIEWNEGAFDSLVLPDSQKSIVKALVESHTFHPAQNIDDVIQGKGRGLVAVLHGPPGTGKTLTAEGIAELLRCPLYMVSAGELGTHPRELEMELNKILDIAHSWGAVLLLDEADVFLEKRTIQDIHRNALVSIFLRLLEYFQGILFLTTNRVETFDDAFQSRIHVALRYGELTTKAKKSVWKMFLGKVQEKDGVETADFKEDDYDTLSRHNLNGRQIKNAVRTAQALAVNEKKPLDMEHLKQVLQVGEAFSNDLRGGTGYVDAMRSYT